MPGRRSVQRGLFDADAVYLDFGARDSLYGYLARHQGRLFSDEQFASRHCSDNGRNSVAP